MRKKAKIRLSRAFLEALAEGESARDTEARGLWAERGARGVSLKWQDVLRVGERTGAARKPVTIRVTIGTWPELSLEQARARALALRAEVKAGRDPRSAEPRPAEVWTIERLVAEFIADQRARGAAATTLHQLERRYRNHIAPLGRLALSELTRQRVREEHRRLTEVAGPVGANAVMRTLRSAWNWAARCTDLQLGPNPCAATPWHPETPRTERLELPPVAEWIVRISEVPSPLRALMHELQLFTGLRPGNAAGLERAWVQAERRAVVFPAGVMKRRRAFHLPLSEYALELLRRALELSERLYPGAPYVFPTRSKDGSRVIATQEWYERTAPGWTGHIVRHMYSNAAARAHVSGVDRQLLMAQTVPGIAGLYLNEPALFDHLRAQQEKVTALLRSESGR